jgi:hypothetical protein
MTANADLAPSNMDLGDLLGLIAQHPLAFAEGFFRGMWEALKARAIANPWTFAVEWGLLLVSLLWPGTKGLNRFGPEAASVRREN